MLDEQFLHANAESRGGDKLEKKPNKQTKCEKIRALRKLSSVSVSVGAKYVIMKGQT